ncbi:MAG: class F sortase [Chloroflexi bacterium]|nr:class F sortase [Chloroflexota bacterium]
MRPPPDPPPAQRPTRRALLGALAGFLLASCSPRQVSAPGGRTTPTPLSTRPPAPSATPPPLLPPPPRRTPVVEPVYLPPVRLRVPAIGVDAEVKAVGLDDQGELVIPTRGDYVVWYAASAPPGLPGNSIFAGHVDWGGRTAVFFRLKELRPDDLIETVASDGAVRTFRMQRSWLVEPAAAPLADIYGPTPRPAVTLITCGGVFLSERRDYSHRLVVRGERPDR